MRSLLSLSRTLSRSARSRTEVGLCNINSSVVTSRGGGRCRVAWLHRRAAQWVFTLSGSFGCVTRDVTGTDWTGPTSSLERSSTCAPREIRSQRNIDSSRASPNSFTRPPLQHSEKFRNRSIAAKCHWPMTRRDTMRSPRCRHDHGGCGGVVFGSRVMHAVRATNLCSRRLDFSSLGI